jgi:hypothetical protein
MADEIDALFKLPLGEFTPARNALAARLKKAGKQALADEVKALPKPSVPAWVVNQIYWRHREPFDCLIEAGERFRDSGGMREHIEARRNAQAALVPIAADILHDAGYSDARNMLRRVTTTLEALSTYGSLPDAPRAGRLTAELEPPGFDLLAGLRPRAGKKPKPAARKNSRDAGRRGEKDRERAAAAAKAALRDMEQAVRTARSHVKRSAAVLETAVKRAKQSDRRRAVAEKQLAKVVKDADAARASAREAESNVRQAALAAERAERELVLARRKFEQLP